MRDDRPRVLFVDDGDIVSARGMTRVIHPARKHESNPVVRGDRPWEGHEVLLGGTVRKEGDLYRMWYQCHNNDTYLNLYAESDDGVSWTKPVLGRYEDFEGGCGNNIYMSRLAFRSGNSGPVRVKQDHNQNVLYTPHLGEGRTYSMLSYDYGRSGYGAYDGYYLAFSEDGLVWTDGPEEPVIPGHADVGWFTFDERDRVFRGTVKSFLNIRGFSRRSVLWTASDDAFHWPLPRPALIPDLEDERWAEGREGCYTQFYGMPIFRHESLILGFLQVFKCTDGRTSSDGTIDVQLASSRDGEHWQRVGDRAPILERGPDGAWDWGLVEGGNSLIVDGDEVRIYYSGYNCRHGVSDPDPGAKTLSIGMGVWPRDRLVGMRAGSTGGELVVNAGHAGEELHLNANASGGSIAVALTDDSGRPVDGFEAADCVPVREDRLDHVVHWRRGASTQSIRGRPVSARVVLTRAELFSLWWE